MCCNLKYYSTSSIMSVEKKYRISTITATGSLNTEINLEVLYDSFSALQMPDIVYIEYGKKKIDWGHNKKFINRHLRSSTASTKRFDNQVTLVYRVMLKETLCMLNTKIFKNGNVQMTRIRNIDQGREMIERIVEIIRNLYDTNQNCISDIEKLSCSNYKLRLINSDFRINYDIRREQLYKMLIEKYQMNCSFEPCIYPAVKIKYYFNDDNSCRKDGICYCSKKCMIGKSSGCGDNQCKKVTIAVFQSGCIIITGGQSIAQVDEAYDFITRILADNIDVIKKKMVLVPMPIKTTVEYSAQNVEPKKYLIKCSCIH